MNIILVIFLSTACEPGYFGPLCSSKCPSGTFGTRCAGICYPMCPDDKCDYIHGCLRIQKNTIQTTKLGKKKGKLCHFERMRERVSDSIEKKSFREIDFGPA